MLNTVMQQDQKSSSEQLQRALGLSELVFYGVGTIIGAGIYSVIGKAAAAAGEALWLSFLLAAVPASLTALSYAELAASFPRAGAEYVYVRQASPHRPWIGTAIGVLVALTGATTAATVALAFGGYLQLFVDLPVLLSAGALLVLCALVNIAGIKESSRVNVIFTVAEIAGLVLIIALGIDHSDFGAALAFDGFHFGIVAGAGLIFFVYTGFEGLANLAEESREPERNLPRALMICLAVTIVLYLLIALAVVALASVAELAGSASPLSLVAGKTAPILASALGVIALVSTANTALISIIVASRVLFGMARGNDIPRVLARLTPGRRTPWLATVLLLGLGLILLPLGGIDIVASLSSFVSLLVFMAVNATVILLRYRQPDHPRPFRVPLSIGRFSPLPAIAILTSAGLMTQFAATVYIAGSFAVGSVFGLMLIWNYRRHPRRG